MPFLVSSLITEAADLANLLVDDTSGNLTSAQALSCFQRTYERTQNKPFSFNDFLAIPLALGQKRYVIPQQFQEMRKVFYSTDRIYPSISTTTTFTINTGVNDAMNVEVDGRAALSVTLANGVYTPAQMATELQSKIAGTRAQAYGTSVMILSKSDITGSLKFNAVANSAYATLGMTSDVGDLLSSNAFYEVFPIYDESELSFPVGSNSIPVSYSLSSWDSVASTGNPFELELFPAPNQQGIDGTLVIKYATYHGSYLTTDYVNLPDYWRLPLIYSIAEMMCVYDRNPELQMLFKAQYLEASDNIKEQLQANRPPPQYALHPNVRSNQGGGTFQGPWPWQNPFINW